MLPPQPQKDDELVSQYGGSVQLKSTKAMSRGPQKPHVYSDGVRANPFHRKRKKTKKKKVMTAQEKKLKKMIGVIMEDRDIE